MTDFDAIRAVLAEFPPSAGWICSKILWRQALQVEHPQLGVRICRVTEDGAVSVIKTDPPGVSKAHH
jgi:hypothetical protein